MRAFTWYHLFPFLFSSVYCSLPPYVETKPNRLSVEENEELQRTCGSFVHDSKFKHKVLHGTRMKRGDTPWVASLLYSNQWTPDMTEEELDNASRSLCTGTLISKRHVLTAGHCVDIVKANCSIPEGQELSYRNTLRWRIFLAGSCATRGTCNLLNRTDELIEAKVSRIITPRNFTGKVCDNPNTSRGDDDLAIFELEEDIILSEYVFPACISTKKPNRKSLANGYGFGFDAADKVQNREVLKGLRWKIVDCPDSEWINYKEHICAEGTKMKLGCQGDSGHGMIIRDRKTAKAHVVGVYSNGYECDDLYRAQLQDRDATSPYEEVFMDISNPQYLQMICLSTGICPIPVSKVENEDMIYRSYGRLPNHQMYAN